jgi:hypothetical protein
LIYAILKRMDTMDEEEDECAGVETGPLSSV